MKFFSLRQLMKSWSVQVWATVPILSTVDFSTTWLDGIIPEQYKPVVYGVLATLGLVARSIKQPKLK